MARVSVYELVDPRDDQVFYVGKGLLDRPRRHLMETRRWVRMGKPNLPWEGANLHKLRRILLIVEAGYKPIVRHVRWFVSDEAALNFEANLILEHGLENLTNLTEGGQGGGRLSAEVRAKISRANKGKTRTPEQRRRISAAQIGRRHSEAAKRKMREAKRGYKQTPEHVAKVAAANRDRAKYPTVRRECRECGEVAEHRQRKVKKRLWVQPRCIDCHYENHKRYMSTRKMVS